MPELGLSCFGTLPSDLWRLSSRGTRGLLTQGLSVLARCILRQPGIVWANSKELGYLLRLLAKPCHKQGQSIPTMPCRFLAGTVTCCSV
jgi:hypothetical protein